MGGADTHTHIVSVEWGRKFGSRAVCLRCGTLRYASHRVRAGVQEVGPLYRGGGSDLDS